MATPIVDVHTHVYPPKYVELLKSRSEVPYIRTFDSDLTARLIILPREDDPSTPSTARGRPIGPEYFDIAKKIAFMDQHGIDISVISQANPWLDFLSASEATDAAVEVNDDINNMCEKYPGRLFAFGTLPVKAGAEACVREIKRLKGLKWMRGVVLGTGGMGQGLDDPKMECVYTTLEEAELPVFLHPHYGLPSEVYGPRAGEYGHVLPLSLGFPIETTIAVTRMIVSGVFDRHLALTLLLAHSGGTLPFLAGRLESCILHDAHLKKLGKLEKRRDIWDILKKNILLDAVVYSGVGVRAAVEASGEDRLLFGKWKEKNRTLRVMPTSFCLKSSSGGHTSRVARFGMNRRRPKVPKPAKLRVGRRGSTDSQPLDLMASPQPTSPGPSFVLSHLGRCRPRAPEMIPSSRQGERHNHISSPHSFPKYSTILSQASVLLIINH